jgi:hypothetical protein
MQFGSTDISNCVYREHCCQSTYNLPSALSILPVIILSSSLRNSYQLLLLTSLINHRSLLAERSMNILPSILTVNCNFMKRIIYVTTFILFSFVSCKRPGNEPAASPGTPAALQEKSSSSEIGLSKSRNDDDLVESLYAELLEKNPKLKELEKTIDDLNDQKSDSGKIFGKYDSKNISYYNAAQQHMGTISDSILRLRIKAIIDNSLNKYNNNVARHKNLISMINSKDITLENLHIVLKIVKTLPVMEKYQIENLPSTKPMERVVHNFDKAIQQTDSLTKQ